MNLGVGWHDWPGWVAYASSMTVGVELARLREATRRMRFVDGADVYDVQADGKLAFIAGTRACPGNQAVIAELGWAAPHTPATTLAPCVSSIGVAIAADRVLAVDIAQGPDRVTR